MADPTFCPLRGTGGVEQKAETETMLPVINAFKQAHQPTDVTVVADAGMSSCSGEIERNYRLLRLEGYAAQMRYHSPTSQYGQMSRADRYDGLDVPRVMREVLSEIESGTFADEWDAGRDAGYPNLERLRAEKLSPEVVAFEEDLRTRLGERA
jgi:ketol-acid reductoisomerase